MPNAGPLRQLAGLPEPVGRIALGTVNVSEHRRDASFALLDAFVELGGSLVDTAARYGMGESERVIGAWMRARPVAAGRLTLLTKGGHPDTVTWRSRLRPDDLEADITGSLERLGVDRVAVYLVHRDDETVPVGEIVDLLDEQVRRGRTLAVGVSNWRLERLDAAVEWAMAHGRAPLTLTSEYLGLAEPTAFPWRGCVAARDEESLGWHERTGVPLLAWSSQSGGFFAEGWATSADPELLPTYDTAANRARRERAGAWGAARGLTAAQVALAWVLSAPSAPLAVAGARTADGLARALEALHVPMTPADRAWLDTGTGDPA